MYDFYTYDLYLHIYIYGLSIRLLGLYLWFTLHLHIYGLLVVVTYGLL